MKFKIKKALLLSTTSLMSVGTIAASSALVGNTNNTRVDNRNTSVLPKSNDIQKFDPNKPLIFKGVQYKNLYHAIEEYTKQQGNVSEQLFLGNIEAAKVSNSGNANSSYTLYDLNKLKKYDVNKMSKAYKLASDKYTSSLDEAKKSYLRNPIIAFTDNNGLLFDTESEAAEFIAKNTSTAPVAFYEIKDFTNLDSKLQPKVKKINPLNLQDIETLKKVGLSNALLSNVSNAFNPFEIERYDSGANAVKTSVYEKKEYFGKTAEQQADLLKKMVKELTDIVKNNMWLNVKIDSRIDSSHVRVAEWGYRPTGMVKVWSDAYIDYVNTKSGHDWNASVSYEELQREIDTFYNLTAFRSKFDIHNDLQVRNTSASPDFAKKHLAEKAVQKNSGAKILGQQFQFEQNAAGRNKFVNAVQFEGLSPPDDKRLPIGFLGSGRSRNVYFEVLVNQQNFNRPADSIINAAVDEAVKLFDKYKDILPQDDEFKQSVSRGVRNCLEKKLLLGEELKVPAARDRSIFDEKMNTDLTNIIMKEINEVYFSNRWGKYKSFEKYLASSFEKQFYTHETVETRAEDKAIYTLSYNGKPVYKLDNTIFESIYSTEAFRINPLTEVKRYLKSLLNTNYTANIKKIVDTMVNVSNVATLTPNSDVKKKINMELTYGQIADYEKASTSFDLINKDITTEFDPKYKGSFVNEATFASFGATEEAMRKALNAKDDDSLDNLNLGWGTFKAIQLYNKNLEKYLAKKPTDIQKKTLEKNVIKSAKDIVSLFEKDGSPAQIKYAEYFDNSYKFNQPLSSDDEKIVYSSQAKEKYVQDNKLNKPSQVVVVKDLDGNVMNMELINDSTISSDGYATSKEQALINAYNTIDIKEDVSKIYYTETRNENGQEVVEKHLIDNKVTKLYVLKTVENITTTYRGFTSYSSLYNYLAEVITLNSTGNGTLPDSGNSIYAPFGADTIKWDLIKRELSTVNSIDKLNQETDRQKFDRFGKALGFNVSNDESQNQNEFNKWQMYIKSFTFSNPTTRNTVYDKSANLTIQLKDGFKFRDGNTWFTQKVDYSSAVIIDDADVQKQQRASTATVASVLSSIFAIIILEAIFISIVLINKKNKESTAEKKLMRLVKR